MLKFHDVSFSYGDKLILDHLSFEVKKGEIVALMGSSGIGKSTVLNLAAGLRKPTHGHVICNASRISYAFQEPRLFPWMTVLQNINAVLSGKSETLAEAMEALRTVELADSAALYPDELSGGMKSRVSLARALAYGGDLYLFDEAFAALDDELRGRLGLAVRTHLQKNGATALLVTHQHSDAARLADRTIRL